MFPLGTAFSRSRGLRSRRRCVRVSIHDAEDGAILNPVPPLGVSVRLDNGSSVLHPFAPIRFGHVALIPPRTPDLRNRRSTYELHALRVGDLDGVDYGFTGDPETRDLAASYPLRPVFSGFERFLPTLTPSVNGQGPDCRVSDRDQKPAGRDEEPTRPGSPPLRYAHSCPANQCEGSGDCDPRVGQGTLNFLPRRKPSGVTEYRDDTCDQREATNENRNGADAAWFLGHG